MIFACPARHAQGSLFQPHMWLSGKVSTPQKPRSTRRSGPSAEGDNRGQSLEDASGGPMADAPLIAEAVHYAKLDCLGTAANILTFSLR
jgi:hypothetical protein